MARPLLMYYATMKRLNLTGCPVSPGVSRLQRLQLVPSVDVAYSSAAGEVVSDDCSGVLARGTYLAYNTFQFRNALLQTGFFV